MVATIFRLVGIDLQRQFARLKLEAEEFKQRTTDEIRSTVASIGITIGLVVVALFLLALTVVVGLVALYLWVAQSNGAFAGLAVVGTVTLVAAALLFTIAVNRGRRKRSPPTPDHQGMAAPAANSGTLMADRLKQQLTESAAGTASAALDSVADAIRKSPRNAVFATLAAAALVGIILGRRR